MPLTVPPPPRPDHPGDSPVKPRNHRVRLQRTPVDEREWGRSAAGSRSLLGSSLDGYARSPRYGAAEPMPSPEGGRQGGIFRRGHDLGGRVQPMLEWAGVLADQSELAGAGDGLRAVGRAEFVQDVSDVLLHRVQGH